MESARPRAQRVRYIPARRSVSTTAPAISRRSQVGLQPSARYTLRPRVGTASASGMSRTASFNGRSKFQNAPAFQAPDDGRRLGPSWPAKFVVTQRPVRFPVHWEDRLVPAPAVGTELEPGRS